MRPLLVCTTALAALGGLPSAAHAEIEYPWCAEMMMDPSGSVENCGFHSEAQCESYISGIGGYCQRNLRYGKSPPKPRRRTRDERRPY